MESDESAEQLESLEDIDLDKGEEDVVEEDVGEEDPGKEDGIDDEPAPADAKLEDQFDEILNKLRDRFSRHESHIKEIAKAEKAKEALEAEEVVEEITVGLSEEAAKAVEESNKRLVKIQRDGSEFIGNISAVANLHEAKALFEADIMKRKREEELFEANQKIQNELEMVMSKWENLKDDKVPQKLYQTYLDLKAGCNEIIAQKDAIIQDLNKKLKHSEKEYVQSLKKQEVETSLASERITQLIQDLRKASKEELAHIQAVLDDDLAKIVAFQMKEYEDTHKNAQENEEKYIGDLEKAAEKHAQELINTKLLQSEEMAALRTKIENDIHSLELQLEKMKAIFILNQDKLEYGFQVLQKRHEEAVTAIFELKRTYANLFDYSIQQKGKLEEINRKGEEKCQQLEAEIKHIRDQIPGLNKSANFFQDLDSKKFCDVFKERKAEACKLVREVVELDRIICETILFVSWEPIDLSFLKKKAPFETQDPSVIPEESFVKDGVVKPDLTATPLSTPQDGSDITLTQAESSLDMAELFRKLAPTTGSPYKIVQPQELKKLLDFICNEMGFLVEERLMQLLEPLKPNEKAFLTLDAILRAVGISTMDNVTELTAYMAKHSQKFEDEEYGEQICLTSKDVLEAFKEYLDAQRIKSEVTATEEAPPLEQFRLNPDFWKSYEDILPKYREVVWDNLYVALKKHYFCVRKRAQLLNEKRELMIHNKEIGGLLHHYMGLTE